MNQKYLRSILTYDSKTGVFRWKIQKGKRVKAGDIAGCANGSGYIHIEIDKKKYKCHRLAWLYVYGFFPNECLDHINLKKYDNRIVNLREADKSANDCNRGLQLNNTSGYKGVSFKKNLGKFQATIALNSKQFYLGVFKTAEEAHEAYCKKGKELHGEFFNGG